VEKKRRVSLRENRFRKFQSKFKSLTFKTGVTYLIALGIFIGTWVISLPGAFTCRTEFKEGFIVQEDIYAPLDFWVLNAEETQAARDKKISEFYRPVCDLNPQAREDSLKNLSRLIEQSELPHERKEEIRRYLNKEYPEYILPADFRQSLVKAGNKSVLFKKDKAGRTELKVEKIADSVQLGKTILPYLRKNLELSPEDLNFVDKAFVPTLIYNPKESENYRDELANSVHPKEKFIAQGENIARKGEKITLEQLRNLNTLSKILTQVNLKRRILGIGLLIIIVMGIIALYLYKLPREFNLLNQYLGVVGIVSVGILILAKCFLNWFPPIFIPVASGAMLIALLLSTPLAIAFALFMSILTSNLAGGEFNLLIIFLVSSLVGILAVRHVRQRLDLFKAIVLIGLVNTAAILSLGLINTLEFSEIGRQVFWAWGNSLLCVIMVTAISPIFETVFKITSDINLLELSDLNRPILRKLMIEASGTYHHSLIVGNLAEAAAEKIRANCLLARVGSYYHDIGKLYKPEYFSENQAKSKSPHEKLTPRMSSLVIAAHVKEGVILAKESKLPQILVDFIEQHHGTTLMWIFYQAALEKKGADEIKEEDFRYPGPKPQSREIAIVMLADAVEAASRTLDEPTPSRIRSLVKQIINDKFLDAQLEECNLTLRDLHEIGESFIYTLTGLFHVRVEYPQNGKKNNDRRGKRTSGTNPVSLDKKNRSENT